MAVTEKLRAFKEKLSKKNKPEKVNAKAPDLGVEKLKQKPTVIETPVPGIPTTLQKKEAQPQQDDHEGDGHNHQETASLQPTKFTEKEPSSHSGCNGCNGGGCDNCTAKEVLKKLVPEGKTLEEMLAADPRRYTVEINTESEDLSPREKAAKEAIEKGEVKADKPTMVKTLEGNLMITLNPDGSASVLQLTQPKPKVAAEPIPTIIMEQATIEPPTQTVSETIAKPSVEPTPAATEPSITKPEATIPPVIKTEPTVQRPPMREVPQQAIVANSAEQPKPVMQKAATVEKPAPVSAVAQTSEGVKITPQPVRTEISFDTPKPVLPKIKLVPAYIPQEAKHLQPETPTAKPVVKEAIAPNNQLRQETTGTQVSKSEQTKHSTTAQTVEQTIDHTDRLQNKKTETKPTGLPKLDTLITFPNILKNIFVPNEKPAIDQPTRIIKGKDRSTRTRLAKSVPAVLSELVTRANRTAMVEGFSSIVLPGGKKRKGKEVTKKSSEKIIMKKVTKKDQQQVFALTVSKELDKPEKQKMKRKRKVTILNRSAEKFALPKTQKKQIEKTLQMRREKKQSTRKETVIQKSTERQTRPIRPILTDTLRARLHARLRGESTKRQTEFAKPTTEKMKERARPLMLVLPENIPVEQVAGAIIRIAKEKRTKEKRTKEKTPTVQIKISKETYQQLKKIFTEVIAEKNSNQSEVIHLMSEDNVISLDINKLQLLEDLFADFETQFLLLQLRQCLFQSEIMEQTVLCGCQSEQAKNSFEKISFCQGCHQGYIQQSLFWLTVMFWYLVKHSLITDEVLLLDQESSPWYTNQSYE